MEKIELKSLRLPIKIISSGNGFAFTIPKKIAKSMGMARSQIWLVSFESKISEGDELSST